MAIGKNKRLSKKGKGLRKRVTDPFLRKEWYDVKAPSMFNNRAAGKTVCTKTTGQKIASDNLKGRVFEFNLADLQKDEEQASRNIKLRCEDVQGRNVLTNFYGFSLTTDRLRSLIRKWCSMIEAHVDVKTTDGFVLRLFIIGFTKRRPNTTRKTCYAQHSHIKAIRKKMVDIATKEATTCEMSELVKKFIPEAIGKEIEKSCQGIYPLQNVCVRKVKMVRSPRLDIGKLLELHTAPTAAAAATAAATTAPAADAKPTEDTGAPVS